MDNSTFGSKFLKNAIISISALCALFQLTVLLPNTIKRTDLTRDVIAYYLVKERIHNNTPIYDQPFELDLSLENGPHIPYQVLYLYPPVLASALALFPQMSFLTFARGWTMTLFFSFWVYALTLAKLSTGKVTFSGTLVAGLFLFICPDSFGAIQLGQVDPLLWMFFGLALLTPKFRNIFTTIIAVIKPWAVWPIIWSLREGRKVWLEIAFILSTSAIICSIALRTPVFMESCLTWFKDVLPSLSQGSWSNANLSISFGFLRILRYSGLWNYRGGELPLLAKSWLCFCSITAPCIIGWLLSDKSKTLQFSAIACGAILFSPICWASYLPILLTPISIIFHQRYYA